MRNLWAEDVTVKTVSVQWEDTVQFTLVDASGNLFPANEMRAQPRRLAARRRQAGAVEQRFNGLHIFSAESEDQVELRFAPFLPDGQYAVRATLALQASPSRGGTVSQTLVAEMPFTFITPSARGERLEAMYREALLASIEGRLFETREQLGELLKLSPNSSAALMLFGDIAVKERNPAEARKYYAAARSAMENRTDVDTVAANASRAAGRLQILDQKMRRAVP